MSSTLAGPENVLRFIRPVESPVFERLRAGYCAFVRLEQTVELLKEAGLSGYEARAYLALLSAPGPLNGYEVAKSSGVPRSTIYETLQRLVAAGLAHTSHEGGSSVEYVPLSPDRFISGLRREMNRTIEGLKETLPDFAPPSVRGVSRRVSGRLNVRNLFIDVMEASTETCLVALWPTGAREVASTAHEIVARGVELAGVLYGDVDDFPGHVILRSRLVHDGIVKTPSGLIYLAVADREQCLVGIRQGGETWGVWSNDRAMVGLAADFVTRHIRALVMAARLVELGESEFVASLFADETEPREAEHLARIVESLP